MKVVSTWESGGALSWSEIGIWILKSEGVDRTLERKMGMFPTPFIFLKL